MKKTMHYILVLLSLIVLIVSTLLLSNPLYKSEEHLKAYILKITPIGTSMEDVIQVIESKKNYEYGYGKPGRPDSDDIALGRTTVVGEKSIRVFMGKYGGIFETNVTVFYGFDEDSKLINVYVRKDIDGL